MEHEPTRRQPAGQRRRLGTGAEMDRRSLDSAAAKRARAPCRASPRSPVSRPEATSRFEVADRYRLEEEKIGGAVTLHAEARPGGPAAGAEAKMSRHAWRSIASSTRTGGAAGRIGLEHIRGLHLAPADTISRRDIVATTDGAAMSAAVSGCART